jgi:hypothetical protein
MGTPNTAAIATAISNLSVSGVTFKDVTAIPVAVSHTQCPIFFPDPQAWYGKMDSRVDLDSPANQIDVVRTLRYIYLHKQSTAANPITSQYASMAANVDLIYTAIANIAGGAYVVNSIRVSQLGEIEALQQVQTRNVFFGCFFEIDFSEIVYR